MREIKFRVWTEYEFQGKILKKMAGPENWFLLSQAGKVFSHGPMQPIDQNLEHKYKVLIVEFFTGLLDKNGKEIYEGDIVEGPHDYGPGGFKTQKGLVQFHETLGYQWNYWDFDAIEIIGNIHENPELLK